MAEMYERLPLVLDLTRSAPKPVRDAVLRNVYDQWVAVGRPTASPRPKPLRLRIEPEGPAGPGWLSLLALIGWMKGVVTWETGPWSP